MKKLLFSILLCAGMIACNNKKATTDNSNTQQSDNISTAKTIRELPPLSVGDVYLKEQNPFGEIVELQGKHITEADTFIFKLKEPVMLIRDSLLLMKSYHAPFYAFRFPDFTHIRTIGKTGNGPDEFLVPQISPSANPEHVAYLLEGLNGNVYGLRRDLKPVYLHNIYAGENKGYGVDEFTNISPNKYLYVYDSKPGRGIFQVEMDGDSARINEVFNLTLNKQMESPFAYYGSMAVNTQRNRMVYAYKYFKVVKFMDMEGKNVRTLNFQQKGFDDGSLHMADGIDSNLTHYMQVLPTDDYVYITYSGRTPYEVAAENGKQNFYMYIEQYDWNGNPVKKYRINDFSISATINNDTKQLVLSAYYYDDPFVVYQLDADIF